MGKDVILWQELDTRVSKIKMDFSFNITINLNNVKLDLLQLYVNCMLSFNKYLLERMTEYIMPIWNFFNEI